MAYQHNYDSEYIKSVGCNLWQLLSRTFDRQVNKSNFVPFMRQRVTQLVDEKTLKVQDHQVQPIKNRLANQQNYYWTTAPDVKFFEGRTQEINTLELWSKDPDSRCIIISGMVGSGKTTLVTKFARKIKNQFDYVIWFSLLQTPTLATLINSYLKIIKHQNETPIDFGSLELSFSLSEFINCLKQKKILLILDDLHCIFDVNETNASYKKDFEEYGRFLRSIISTNHQSLLVATSCIKPKMLEYYNDNQVKMLDLQGFNIQATKAIINSQNNSLLEEEELLFLSTSLQSNPQLLNIVKNHLDDFGDFLANNAEQVLQDMILIDEISNLLEQELFHLSDLEREIIYWLAIEKSQGKLKFVQSINSLIKRSLIIKKNSTYTLMPIMKIYVRRKLVKQALVREKYN